jgi:hypothetical protein
MRFVLAILLIPFSLPAQEASASITGGLTDVSGAYIVGVPVDLDSGTRQYQVRTSVAGVYQFSNLPAGEYTLTFRVTGFHPLTVNSIVVLEHQQKRMPDVPLEVVNGLCPRPIARDQVLLPAGGLLGRLSGSVSPPIVDVEVTLICRTFRECASTTTNADGRFSFDMLSPGIYGLNFRRDGFYPENATGYSYHVNAGWESIYSPAELERCPNRDCDPKLRAPKPPSVCE